MVRALGLRWLWQRKILYYVSSNPTWSPHLQNIWIFGYYVMQGLKMRRGSLLHSTIFTMFCCVAWTVPGNVELDEIGLASRLQQPWSPETHSPIMIEKKQCTKSQEIQMGAEVEGDVLEACWVRGSGSLRDGCGNTKCGAGAEALLQAEEGQGDTYKGFAEHRHVTSSLLPHLALHLHILAGGCLQGVFFFTQK